MKRKKNCFFSNYLRHYYLKLFGSLLKFVICFVFFQMTTWWFDENIFSVFSSVHTLQSAKRQCDESPLALLSFLASKVFESRQSETWCPRRTPVDDMQHTGVQMIFNSHLKSIVFLDWPISSSSLPLLIYYVVYKEFFRTCNVLPFSCTHLALWRGKVKDPRYMQNKNDSRISLVVYLSNLFKY